MRPKTLTPNQHERITRDATRAQELMASTARQSREERDRGFLTTASKLQKIAEAYGYEARALIETLTTLPVAIDCAREDREHEARMERAEARAERRTRWEEQGRPMDPPEDARESRFSDDNGGGPED